MKRKIVFSLALCVLAVSIVCFIKESLPFAARLWSGQNEENLKESTEEQQSLEEILQSGDDDAVIAAAKELDTIGEDVKPILFTALENKQKAAYDEAIVHIRAYDYQKAAAVLESFKSDVPPSFGFTVSEESEKLLQNCKSYSTLTEYQGPVEHIFFHPLIAYKELAFDGDYQEKGLDDYFTTVPEFKEVIRQLYENNYILIDIGLIYDVEEDGSVTKSKLMLPEGKKPVVISIDDLNFYDYMKEHGMAHGFMIQDGRIVTYSDRPDGTRDISDDNAIVPILDRFVKEHPDFSFGGAKGIIASTGYNGTLGFPTHETESPDYQENFKKAKEMADHLKSTGWSFASHSYGHGSPSKQSYEKLCRDNDLWIKEVVPIVGETDVYIYPYGELIDVDDPKHKYIEQNGFKMFCGVQSREPYLRFYDGSVLMQRRNIDGIAMKGNKIGNMFDVSLILDPDRPKYD